MQRWGERRTEDRASIERADQAGILISLRRNRDKKRHVHKDELRYKASNRMSTKVKYTKLFAVRRLVRTHPAAPVMMAFFPLSRSPRFVLAMIEKRREEKKRKIGWIKKAGSRRLDQEGWIKKVEEDALGVCPTCAKVQSDFSLGH